MSSRAAFRLAWGLWALYLVLGGAGVSMLVYVAVTPGPSFSEDTIWFAVVFLSGLFVFSTVGAVIASRRPEDAVGWLMCAFAPLWMVQGLGETYAELATLRPEAVSGGEWAYWLAEWVWIPALMLPTVFLPLLFPNGRLLSRRWAIVGWLAVVGAVAWIIGDMIAPLPAEAAFDNPIGIESAADGLRWLRGAGAVLFLCGIAGSALSVIVRLTRARGVERQQLKWFVYAAALMAVGMVLSGASNEIVSSVGWFIVLAALLLGFPFAIGVAVLRYRLYDIDRIINRTLVYGLVTAALGLTYLGLVVGLQALFEPFTGGSDIAIALTTLIVAGLFFPVRQRIQDAVDSRFNRRRYDAARTLELFSVRLRDEVDMDTLQGDLIAVVNETVQPAHVSLWLRAQEAQQ
jgi:hypothetical protein